VHADDGIEPPMCPSRILIYARCIEHEMVPFLRQSHGTIDKTRS